MRVGGVDEAGRGCVLGPLAVAGVSIDSRRLNELKELGVRDSKVLSSAQSDVLFDEIVRMCDPVKVSYARPDEIDSYVRKGRKHRRLNYLETIHMARIIDELGADEVFVDAPDANPRRFTLELKELLSCKPRIVAEHKADANYPVVSAASIIAKVHRDREIARLHELHGDFGSGYPSDPDTIEFLKAWVKEKGTHPEFARKSWRTWDRITPTLD